MGKDGVITVAEGKTVADELTVVEGMKVDRGYISPYFVTDQKTQKCEMENPYVLIFEKAISQLAPLLPLLEAIVKTNRPLLIVAEDVEGEALAALVVNKLRGGVKVCAIKAPGFGDNRKAYLQDLAILTGGQLISNDLDMKLEDVSIEQLGCAKKVTVTKDDTIILDGMGAKEDLEERCTFLRDSIAQTTSEYEKEKYQERLGTFATVLLSCCLTGLVSYLLVVAGGCSEIVGRGGRHQSGRRV